MAPPILPTSLWSRRLRDSSPLPAERGRPPRRVRRPSILPSPPVASDGPAHPPDLPLVSAAPRFLPASCRTRPSAPPSSPALNPSLAPGRLRWPRPSSRPPSGLGGSAIPPRFLPNAAVRPAEFAGPQSFPRPRSPPMAPPILPTSLWSRRLRDSSPLPAERGRPPRQFRLPTSLELAAPWLRSPDGLPRRFRFAFPPPRLPTPATSPLPSPTPVLGRPRPLLYPPSLQIPAPTRPIRAQLGLSIPNPPPYRRGFINQHTPPPVFHDTLNPNHS